MLFASLDAFTLELSLYLEQVHNSFFVFIPNTFYRPNNGHGINLFADVERDGERHYLDVSLFDGFVPPPGFGTLQITNKMPL